VTARDLLDLAWIIPALPALGAVILLLFGKRIGEPIAGWIGTAFVSLSFVWSVVTFLALRSLPADARFNVSNGFTWIQSGTFRVDFRFLADPLSTTMILFVTGVAALIHLYSIGYMRGDPRFSRFFAYLNLFVASMLVLVLGSSFLLTFMGWEGVGLCSYLLVSFWFERNSAAVAGKKAFVTNRIGDFGFMLAMFLIFEKVGSLDYGVANVAAPHLSQTSVTAIALLLFVGAIGKSAQFPLYVWLPDAMEGPTPVSALIHAATMVTAGVFLIVRANPFFNASDHAGTIVAWTGAFTALFAATIAMTQKDIKKVLAYSTISQLGYMFLAVGIGAYTAAIFLMIVHAFFKALLFLGAGSVIHGVHDEQDMRFMGGLRKYMPFTFVTFIVGWLAIAGVFPLAGFWAKDEILAKAYFSQNYGLWIVGLVAAVFTAFYMTRQVWLVFYDGERWSTSEHMAAHGSDDPANGHAPEPHESPMIMLIPLFVLAGLAMVGAAVDLPFEHNHINLLAPILRTAPDITPSSFGAAFVLSTLALVIAIVGIVVGRAIYKNGLDPDGLDPGEKRLGAVGKVFDNGYYFDIGIAKLVSGPVTAFATFLSQGIDRDVIDGAVNGVGVVFRGLGGGLRRVQTGLVRNYALAIVFGAVLFLAFLSTRATL
jgi:NADH-quinone oxidoreductase subunit L